MASDIRDLAGFLLARIAEDEDRNAMVRNSAPSLTRPGWKRADAECAAKRRIVDLAQSVAADDGWVQVKGDEILATLALPYADHPDYRDEWRP